MNNSCSRSKTIQYIRTITYRLSGHIKQTTNWWYLFLFLLKTRPSCSKLTMSLVNDSLKFTSSDTQICWMFFCWKNVRSFCSAKATHIFFQQKNIRILYIESAKTVNEMTLNELVKLTTLWTTGPRIWHLLQIVSVNKLWHFMQSVSIIENLHDMSYPVFWEK